jgi:hypothetical protein
MITIYKSKIKMKSISIPQPQFSNSLYYYPRKQIEDFGAEETLKKLKNIDA